MSSQLAQVPIEARRKIAATVGLFAVLFTAIGAVAATGTGATAAPLFSAIALVIAVVLGLIAWGMVRSIGIDRAAKGLDAELEAAVTAHGGQMCDCGHEHDPAELHITDACEHDGSGYGSGTACEQNCESCVLAALRPSPAQTRAERAAG